MCCPLLSALFHLFRKRNCTFFFSSISYLGRIHLPSKVWRNKFIYSAAGAFCEQQEQRSLLCRVPVAVLAPWYLSLFFFTLLLQLYVLFGLCMVIRRRRRRRRIEEEEEEAIKSSWQHRLHSGSPLKQVVIFFFPICIPPYTPVNADSIEGMSDIDDDGRPSLITGHNTLDVAAWCLSAPIFPQYNGTFLFLLFQRNIKYTRGKSETLSGGNLERVANTLLS